MSINEKVFISYSHDSVEHLARVLELSNKLRAEGIDCVLDQYEVSPPEGWPRWMDNNIRNANFVLCVCTEIYYRRAVGEEVEGKGLGVRWEGSAIYQHLYDAGALNTKFVPVLFADDDNRFIPTPLRGASFYNVSKGLGYEALYRHLTGQPMAKKPELGERRALPTKTAKPDTILHFLSPIDLELWNEAKWKGTFYGAAPGKIPLLGLGFLNEDAAHAIFSGWRQRFGMDDMLDEIRIAIIEGDIPGEDPGYSVHIGPNIRSYFERKSSRGFDSPGDYFMSMSRIHRMNPGPKSMNLENFKKQYGAHKEFLMVPGVLSEDGSILKVMFDLGIHKNKIYFRHVSDVGKSDEDYVVLRRGEKV